IPLRRGEDWPAAYRHCPMDGDSSRCCVVAWWHAGWGEPAFQLYTGLLFGLPLAVTTFNRYSRAAEAFGRRLLAILVSMYFDDAHFTDGAVRPRPLLRTFLGLDFDFGACLRSGLARFFVRDRLVEKVRDLIEQAVQTQSLPPGLAAKNYGTCNFLEQGMYGRVGASGLRAIRERADEGGRELTPPILSCFALIRAVLAARPERQFDILPRVWPRFLAASDAAEDDPGQGSGGFHLVWLVRESFVAAIGPEVYACSTPGDQKIAQLELAMVLYALAVRAPSFRGRRGFWYIDFALRTSFFFEYIPSKNELG
ncbi:FCPB, partial [Symbiodinium necroappetens]